MENNKTIIIKKNNQNYANYGKKTEYSMENSNNSTVVDIKINQYEYEKLISNKK